jgi:hypothetical protein
MQFKNLTPISTSRQCMATYHVSGDVLAYIGGAPAQHQFYSQVLNPCDFWLFSTLKYELRRTYVRTGCSAAKKNIWLVKGVTSKRKICQWPQTQIALLVSLLYKHPL